MVMSHNHHDTAEEQAWGAEEERVAETIRRTLAVRKDRRVGWYVAVLVAVVALVMQYFTWVWKQVNKEVYILDRSGNVYYGALHDASHFSLFHQLATDAAMIFFQRSASGGGSLDMEEMALRLYHRRSFELLKQDLQKQKADLAHRSIHQKAEIGSIRQMEEKSGSVYVLVEGQLVRAGQVGNLPVAESEPFSLVLRFERSHSVTPGGAPWLVTEWSRRLPDSY